MKMFFNVQDYNCENIRVLDQLILTMNSLYRQGDIMIHPSGGVMDVSVYNKPKRIAFVEKA